MDRLKLVPVFVLLVLLLGAIIVAMSQAAGPIQSKQGSETFALRARTAHAALSRNDLFDCATYLPDVSPVLPVEQQIFHIVQDIKVTPDDGKEYLGAVWSPNGEAMVFVVPTGGHRDIPDDDRLASDEEIQLVAVSKDEFGIRGTFRNPHLRCEVWSDASPGPPRNQRSPQRPVRVT